MSNAHRCETFSGSAAAAGAETANSATIKGRQIRTSFQLFLSHYVSQIGGLAIPLGRLHEVLRHALAEFVLQAQGEHCTRTAMRGRRLEPTTGDRKIALDAPALHDHVADEELPVGVLPSRRHPVVFHGLGVIPRDLLAIFIGDAESDG